MTEKIETISKAPKFKVNDIFSEGYTENWSREIFIIDSVLKTNPWTYKIKDLNRKTIIGSFIEKELYISEFFYFIYCENCILYIVYK